MSEDKIEFISNQDRTVAIIEDEAYNIEKNELIVHEDNDNSVYLISEDEYYITEFDEDGWLKTSCDIPDDILDKLDEKELRFSDVEARGLPTKFDVTYRSDTALYDSVWQNEVFRPSTEEAINLQGVINSVTLEIEMDENKNITIVGLRTWPDNIDVNLKNE